MGYIDGLVQESHNSIANALESRLPCNNPSIWCIFAAVAVYRILCIWYCSLTPLLPYFWPNLQELQIDSIHYIYRRCYQLGIFSVWIIHMHWLIVACCYNMPPGIWINIGSGNGLKSDSTKPLLEWSMIEGYWHPSQCNLPRKVHRKLGVLKSTE